MRIEIPELKKCCCCLPLRRGLLVWIYFQLALGSLLLLYFISCLVTIISMNSAPYRYVVITIATIIFVMDIAFCIVFIISAHRKNHQQMRIYYRYAIGILILEVITMLVFAGLDIYTAIVAKPEGMFILNYTESMCFMFIQIVLQAYLVILVRSEMLKLERGAKFEFINHSTEPECKAQI